MKRALLGVMAMLASAGAGSARADEVPTVMEVRRALVLEHYGEGYRLAERLVAARPADPDAAFLAGEACVHMAFFGKAKDHLRVALQDSPSDARLHGVLARIAVIEGDDDTARKEAGLALTLDGEERIARAVMDELEMIDRFTRGDAPKPAPGSASELVVRLAQMVSRGAPSSELAPLVDHSMFARRSLPAPAGTDPAASVIDGLFDVIKASPLHVAAWEVGPAASNGVVPVHVLLEIRWTISSVAAIPRSFDAASTPGLFGSIVENRLKGLDPQDRGIVLGRLVGTRLRVPTTLQVHVVTVDGGPKVADVEVQQMSLRALVRKSAVRFANVLERGAPPATGRGVFSWIAYIQGYVGVTVGLVFLLLRTGRRRRARPRPLPPR